MKVGQLGCLVVEVVRAKYSILTLSGGLYQTDSDYEL